MCPAPTIHWKQAAVKRRLVLSLLEVLREFSMHPANTAPLVRADVVATLVELLAVVPRIKVRGHETVDLGAFATFR